MNLEKFISLFAEEFDETPVDIFNSETVFKDLDEWDSLTALSIIAMIDDEFEKEITGANLRNCPTIQDLHELIIKL